MFMTNKNGRSENFVPIYCKKFANAGEKKQFVRTFGAAEGEKNKLHGYRKRTHDDSDDGYNHFDSFHKKKGDKYGYETYSSYGLKEHGDDAGSHHEHSGKEEGEECKLI